MGRSEGTVTVAKYEPPRSAVLQGQMGKMTPTVTLTVESQGEGSRFTRRVRLSGTPDKLNVKRVTRNHRSGAAPVLGRRLE